MRHFIGAALASLTVVTAQAQADPLVMLELYTSQGCSSCPPADELLRDLAAQDGVLAMSFHVDYWDYIGWLDTFASRENTKRQKMYAHGFGQRMVYTPQLVVQGKDSVVGHKAAKIESLVKQYRALPAKVVLEATREDGMIKVAVSPIAKDIPEAELYLLRYLPEATVDIEHGENAGKSITYVNVVMDWHLAELWSGSQAEEYEIPVMGDLPAAVVLQKRGQGEVLAAALAR